MRRAWSQLLFGGWLLAVLSYCASPPPPPPTVEVEIWSGSARAPAIPAAGTEEEVLLLVDFTDSMRAATELGVPYFATARSSALQLLTALPPAVRVRLRFLGGGGAPQIAAAMEGQGGPACREPAAFQLLESRVPRDALAQVLRRAQPGDEVSLAQTLLELRRELSEVGPLARFLHLVIFSDVGAECGGDLCVAAEQLHEAGIFVHWVRLSAAPAPTCLSDFAQPSLLQILPELKPLSPAGIPFEVRSAVDEALLAQGRTEEGPVPAVAGSAHVSVALEPPLTIGPVKLVAGRALRVRVLEFPTADPPLREWILQTSEPNAEIVREVEQIRGRSRHFMNNPG